MLIFDLETDGLLDELTRIHTLHVLDTDDGRAYRFNGGVFDDGSPAARDGSIEEGIAMLAAADGLVGHNILTFDIPAIQKLHPDFTFPIDRVHDTLVYARLIYPHLSEIDLKAIRRRKRPEGFGKLVGSHKLEAWGIRLGENKGDYGEVRKAEGKKLGLKGEELSRFVWGTFNPEMEEYAAQDVVVTDKLWKVLDGKQYPADALRLEHRVAEIIFWQERHGFRFDTDKADDLLRVLTGRKAELEDQLRETFKPWFEPVRKKGEVEVFTPKRDNKRLGYVAGVPMTKTKLIAFNPSSRAHIANRMQTLFGWEPVEFTEGGQPKVDETTLAGLDYPEAKLLVEYLTVDKRLGQLAEGRQAWMKSVREDGRIHGRVNSLGAVTRRMTHSTPNVAQVPSLVNASGPVPFGRECRELFRVDPGHKIVGCDAEGLELRMLGHYMARHDGGAYAEAVVNGKSSDGTDAHTLNQKIVGLTQRSAAKTFISMG
ncbi:DNA polymerase [Alteriqipengyuania flavescens]|uniref:DNA polymerase n=1 Tax=Alteriqipengyuania flavescens TaxID=3053610 RepID=UPI0025B2917F|nr:DNA polymerase [Alteriqipengyuania flavescens]WJY17657.1 DNA polymerase [Alteriqipengyuania flavescens]WJY23600.1 DNA polymerase [Alteriqipengyuania flavescens]